MKWEGWRIEHCWQKMKSESDQTIARTHAQSHAVAIVLEKNGYFASVIASVMSCPRGWFSVVHSLLQFGPMMIERKYSVDCCDVFAIYFTGKINFIRS